jgi:aldehyde:ferredoxin oxidoreductase
MDGVTGCLANIDLSTGKTNIESVSDGTFKRFLGGNGLVIKILIEKMTAGQHPFSQENVHPKSSGRPGVAGRGGLGAVMGSKNLKAVVIERVGGRKVGVHSPALLGDITIGL